MSDIKTFQFELNKFTKSIEQNVIDTQKAAIREIALRVVRRTPIKTGRAKSSWYPGINSPDRTEQPAVTGTPLNASFAEAQSLDRLSMFDRAKLGDTLYLSSNIPYILRIESDGWPGRGPYMPVKLTLLELEELGVGRFL
jgi:hypothetical protein